MTSIEPHWILFTELVCVISLTVGHWPELGWKAQLGLSMAIVIPIWLMAGSSAVVFDLGTFERPITTAKQHWSLLALLLCIISLAAGRWAERGWLILLGLTVSILAPLLLLWGTQRGTFVLPLRTALPMTTWFFVGFCCRCGAREKTFISN
jgi:hypothetical protein